MQKKNSKVAAKTLPPVQLLPADVAIEAQRRDSIRQTSSFKTLAEQVTKSTIVMRNYYLEELRERYKNYDRMKRIDKIFPYAKLGENEATCMVLIDEPKNPQDVEVCYKKAAILKDLGYRYAVIEENSSLIDILEQLGAI